MTHHVSKYGDSRPARKKPSRGITTPQIIQALADLVEAIDGEWDGEESSDAAREYWSRLAEAKRILAELRAK